ncbi:MAG: hypothetical protein M5R38_18590 [Candidatus Methylomirabilis sp.]|nr:hypothetical protein [Candidatus Methylomirabilis sp.]
MERDTVGSVRIRDLVGYYLRLGALGFGGPVALCGQMEKEAGRGAAVDWSSCRSCSGKIAIGD